MAKKKRQKRGFLVALLIGFDEQKIHFWKVYTHSVKRYTHLSLSNKWKYADFKQKYQYFEEIVNILRPIVKNGLKSILLANPLKLNYSSDFLVHINKHHRWLVSSRKDNQVSFGQIKGYARDLNEARLLIEQSNSLDILLETSSDESKLLTNLLEKTINKSDDKTSVLYGLQEIEEFIYMGGKKDKSVAEKLDYLLISDNFIADHKNKNRIYRLKQIAENKGIITRVFSKDTPAGNRINQYGGIVCFKKFD